MLTFPLLFALILFYQDADQYIQALREYTGDDTVDTVYGFGDGAYGYDTVWTAALVLDKADKILRKQGIVLTLKNGGWDTRSR